jgi:hypothetical protein
MTKFYTYNIQLLPNDNVTAEVGTSGYKRLFSEFRALNKQHRTEKTLEEFHQHISGDLFIGPDKFYVKESYVYGYFVRYTKTDVVTNLNSRRTVFQNDGKATTVSKSEDVPFVFDAKRHYFCIEGNNVLSAAFMEEALKKFLTSIAEAHFPNHELSVNAVSEPSSLESIISKAISFKNVDLRATFENGHDDTQGVLKQLKDSKTKTLRVQASGGNATMNKLPPFIEELARAAVITGALSLTYFVSGSAKRQTYNSNESPLAFTARRSSEDDETSFFARVHTKLLEQATRAEEVAHNSTSGPTDETRK